LAVGDAEFQERCLGKMKEVSREGRTVIFVSHQMNAIESLCTRCVVLDAGRVSFQGDNVSKVVRKYLLGDEPDQNAEPFWDNSLGKQKNTYFEPRFFGLYRPNGEKAPFSIRKDEHVDVVFEFKIETEEPSLVFGFELIDENGGTVLTSCHSDEAIGAPQRLKKGLKSAKARIPAHLLNESIYIARMVAALHNRTWIIDPVETDIVFKFRIQGGLSRSLAWQSKRRGVVAPMLSWDVFSVSG